MLLKRFSKIFHQRLLTSCWLTLILKNLREYDSIRERKGSFFVLSNKAFHGAGLLLYPLKPSGNQRISDVFKGYRKRLGVWNGLPNLSPDSYKVFWRQKSRFHTYSSHFVIPQKVFSSYSEMFYQINVLENFAKLTEKHLCRSLFSKRFAGFRQYCSCEFCKIFKSTFFMELLYFVTFSETLESVLKEKNTVKVPYYTDTRS